MMDMDEIKAKFDKMKEKGSMLFVMAGTVKEATAYVGTGGVVRLGFCCSRRLCVATQSENCRRKAQQGAANSK